jgi:uncharacterized SAM-binding protein YcdF (DUF218 family)
MRRKLKRLLFILSIAAAAYLIIISVRITQVAKHVPQAKAAYMIILGAKLNGAEPSLSLKYRMDTALEYLKKNPSTEVIVSGGQGTDELISEADAMNQYLIANHINPTRIKLEAQSTSTFENIQFSKKLLQGNHILLVSNDFHLLRAKLIAERQGLVVDTLSSPTPKSVKIQLYIREYIALIKSFLLDR